MARHPRSTPRSLLLPLQRPVGIHHRMSRFVGAARWRRRGSRTKEAAARHTLPSQRREEGEAACLLLAPVLALVLLGRLVAVVVLRSPVLVVEVDPRGPEDLEGEAPLGRHKDSVGGRSSVRSQRPWPSAVVLLAHQHHLLLGVAEEWGEDVSVHRERSHHRQVRLDRDRSRRGPAGEGGLPRRHLPTRLHNRRRNRPADSHSRTHRSLPGQRAGSAAVLSAAAVVLEAVVLPYRRGDPEVRHRSRRRGVGGGSSSLTLVFSLPQIVPVSCLSFSCSDSKMDGWMLGWVGWKGWQNDLVQVLIQKGNASVEAKRAAAANELKETQRRGQPSLLSSAQLNLPQGGERLRRRDDEWQKERSKGTDLRDDLLGLSQESTCSSRPFKLASDAENETVRNGLENVYLGLARLMNR